MLFVGKITMKYIITTGYSDYTENYIIFSRKKQFFYVLYVFTDIFTNNKKNRNYPRVGLHSSWKRQEFPFKIFVFDKI